MLVSPIYLARVIDVYRDSKYRYYRVDVQFEDGSVVKNKLYSELVKGRVGKPKKNGWSFPPYSFQRAQACLHLIDIGSATVLAISSLYE